MTSPPASRFEELTVRKLDGVPPPGFDCLRDAQNRFFYEGAWPEQRQRLTTTYVYYAGDAPAAYMAVCMDGVQLGTREKPRALHYRNIAALKLAQLGVDQAYQGQGIASSIIVQVIKLALDEAQRVGCRYVTLDAHPDLVGWYQSLGFEINKAMQKQRISAAAGRDPSEIPVSMRFDLREV